MLRRSEPFETCCKCALRTDVLFCESAARPKCPKCYGNEPWTGTLRHTQDWFRAYLKEARRRLKCL